MGSHIIQLQTVTIRMLHAMRARRQATWSEYANHGKRRPNYSVHLGITRMKSLARSFIWWPRLDGDIEDISKNCNECCLMAINPPHAPAHPWLVPQQPWERVHVDHAQWGKWLLLVAIDAFSKWPEVFVVSSTSALQTICDPSLIMMIKIQHLANYNYQ